MEVTLPKPSNPTGELNALVGRAREGESAALSVLSERACTLALRTASAVVGSRELARDVSQDVAVDVLRGLDRLREPQAFDAWVHRITYRHARRALRRQSLLRRREVPVAVAETLTRPDTTPELLALRSVLSSAIESLPVRQRLALALRYVHDLSDAEIAAALGCREGTAAALLSRARSTLRQSTELADLNPALQGETR